MPVLFKLPVFPKPMNAQPVSKILAPLSCLALGTALPAAAALIATGIYDEQDVQTNAVDFSMGYSSNTTWTTGIGQTLGASQIRTVEEFKLLVEAAFLTGHGGVIDFDNGSLQDDQSFVVSFGGASKSMTLSNRAGNGGNYSINGISGNRTAISGDNWLGTGGNPHYDFDIGSFTGFAEYEQVTAIGVTILGRNGTGSNSNWRVIAYYTNGVDSGSSSTFRTINTNTGNTTHDSFSGIVAPDGYWITRMRVHSDQGAFTGIDDIGFITSIIPEPSSALLGMLGLAALMRRRR